MRSSCIKGALAQLEERCVGQCTIFWKVFTLLADNDDRPRELQVWFLPEASRCVIRGLAYRVFAVGVNGVAEKMQGCLRLRVRLLIFQSWA